MVDEDLEKILASEPEIPEDLTINLLPSDIFVKIPTTLSNEMRTKLGLHIVATQFFLDQNPKLAFEHAKFCLLLAPGFDVTQELLGLCAYRLGLYKLALREFIQTRKRNHSNEYIPMIIDSYRALGKDDKAWQLANQFLNVELDIETRVEFMIVYASLLADKGEYETALQLIKKELREKGTPHPQRVRLFEAESYILEQMGKIEEAEEVMQKINLSLERQNRLEKNNVIVYDLEEESNPKDKSNKVDDVTEPRVETFDQPPKIVLKNPRVITDEPEQVLKQALRSMRKKNPKSKKSKTEDLEEDI